MIPMKSTLVAFVILAACTSSAMANDVGEDAVAVARKLDGLCRGSTGDTPNLDIICEARDQAFNLASRLGYCYGKRNQIGADMRWHKCTRDSNK